MREILRKIYHLANGIFGFLYNVVRFALYSSWHHDMRDPMVRNYHAAIVYHALEKSLSYRRRRPDAGWGNALGLLRVLNIAKACGSDSYHERAGREVLEKFVALPENTNTANIEKLKSGLREIPFSSHDIHGSMPYTLEDYHKGLLENPEAFFFSRYSLREFDGEIVPEDVIARAVGLAMKSPSVCNRQPWKVYHTADPHVRDVVLTYQSGNRPFGASIPNLLVVTTDLQAFFGGQEHYQHWIDGGLFSMSLIYALHSLGIATCALNWSQSPKNDMALRKLVTIDPHHTIIMAIAVGYPRSENKVCVSARQPLESVLMTLNKRNT